MCRPALPGTTEPGIFLGLGYGRLKARHQGRSATTLQQQGSRQKSTTLWAALPLFPGVVLAGEATAASTEHPCPNPQ